MNAHYTEISIKGRTIKVPSLQFGGRTIMVNGKWLKIAMVRDEDWLEGEVVNDPDACVEILKQETLNADIFTFTQKLPNLEPKYIYPVVWDNVAAIPTSDYSFWWKNLLPQVTRKNVRRADRRGIVVREVPFDDQLLHGIVEINNETPLRQGRPFWHYGKSFDVVKRDYSTLLEQSEYIGAFYDSELVGFIKLVYMGETASILQLLCKNKHYDKRPANGLIAKAVEICSAKRLKYLSYGKYIYGKNRNSPLTEFKRRNGFQKLLLPRYYIPLTLKGRIVVQLRLHLGLKRFIPEKIFNFVYTFRSKWYKRKLTC